MSKLTLIPVRRVWLILALGLGLLLLLALVQNQASAAMEAPTHDDQHLVSAGPARAPFTLTVKTRTSSLDGGNGFTINGLDQGDRLGCSVNGAGDVNGDGLDDLIIGAYNADPNGKGSAGESYVIFGRGDGFTATLDLTELDGSNGLVINGIDTGDQSGSAVSGAGDVNGDGFDDLIIGAPSANPSGASEAGESYVVFGKGSGFTASLNLSDLDGSNGFTINGVDAEDESGDAISGAGDINGDGFDDIIIGARYASPDSKDYAGESYVVFGKSGGFSATLNLSDLDGNNGFVINGIDESDRAGTSVSDAGDINGDGFDDIIIGALWADPNDNINAGESYVIFGSSEGFSASLNLSDLNGSNGFVLNGADVGDWSGTSVSGAGDVNGDGLADLIIGADGGDVDDKSGVGKSYIVFGKSEAFSASLNLGDLDGDNGFVLNGIDEGDSAGEAVSGAGDVNGDGFDDLIIGANLADPNGEGSAGESYVVFGHAGPFAPSLDLGDLDGSNGFVLNGADAGDFSGAAVGGAGDLNGDGLGDFVIGAYAAGAILTDEAGASYVVFGGPGATTLTATPDDVLRFVPHPDFTGVATLTFRAWDTTDGHLSGDTGVVITETGGAAAFSIAVEEATITILPFSGPGNRPPNTPTNPNPTEGASDVPIDQTLSWQGGDPDGDPVTYTVAFGQGDPPPVVTTDITTTHFTPGPLLPGTAYRWQITATDGLSTTVSPTWHFTTSSPPSDTIIITEMGFIPKVLTIPVNTEVTWYNGTGIAHRLTSGAPHRTYLPIVLKDTGSGRTSLSERQTGSLAVDFRLTTKESFSATLPAGGTFTHTFTTVGEHPHYLASMPRFSGSVIVQEPIVPQWITPIPGQSEFIVPTTITEEVTCLYVMNWWRRDSPPYDIIRSVFEPPCLMATEVERQDFYNYQGALTSYQARVTRQDKPDFDMDVSYNFNQSGGVIGADVLKIYYTPITGTNRSTARFTSRRPVPPRASSNQAPILDNSGTPTLTAVLQNDFDPDGILVSSMLATGANGDPITDPDPDAVEGIAVIATDSGNGFWQFSIDGGQTWADFAPSPFPVSLNLGGDEGFEYQMEITEFCPSVGELVGYKVIYEGQEIVVGDCPP